MQDQITTLNDTEIDTVSGGGTFSEMRQNFADKNAKLNESTSKLIESEHKPPSFMTPALSLSLAIMNAYFGAAVAVQGSVLPMLQSSQPSLKRA